MMVTDGISDAQLSFIVDQTIKEADGDGDGKISFDEFAQVRLRCHFVIFIILACSIAAFSCPTALFPDRQTANCHAHAGHFLM